MLDTVKQGQPTYASMPTTQLSALCHLIVKTDTSGEKANVCAQIAQTARASHYTKPTAWVYDNLYEGAPIGLIFSPTTGLTFYLPIDATGEILFDNACYLEKSFSALTRRMRSGNSILSTELGDTKPVPNGSLAGWIERALGKAESVLQ